MARRRSRSRVSSTSRARARSWPSRVLDAAPAALRVRRSSRLPVSFDAFEMEQLPVPSNIRLVSKARRVYDPPYKRVVSPRGLFAPSMERVAFARPDVVLECARRKERREVIFASGRGGRQNHRSYRRTINSEIKC